MARLVPAGLDVAMSLHLGVAVAVQVLDHGRLLADLVLDADDSGVATPVAVDILGTAAAQGIVGSQAAMPGASHPASEFKFDRRALIASPKLFRKFSAGPRNLLLHVHDLGESKAQARSVERMALARFGVERIAAQVLVLNPVLELDAHVVTQKGVSPRGAVHRRQMKMVQRALHVMGQVHVALGRMLADAVIQPQDVFEHMFHAVGRLRCTAARPSHQ